MIEQALRDRLLAETTEAILVLPTTYFYPTSIDKYIDEALKKIKKESLALHLWEASWKR